MVTLPETTPVSQAQALQDDLRRAGIEPYAWVVNKSLLAAGTTDPLLAARLHTEARQMARLADGVAAKTFVLPWRAQPPVGVAELTQLVTAAPAGAPTNTPSAARASDHAHAA